MKTVQYIKIIIVLAVLIVLARLLNEYEFNSTTEPIIIHTETHTTDTIKIHDTIYKPEYFYSEVQNYDTIINIDTFYIVKDYNTKYLYSDTIINDINAFIVVNDIIYQNRILSRKNDINIYSHTIYKTETIIQPKKWHLIAVGGVSGNKDKFGFDMGLGIRTRKGTDINLGYDPINKCVRIGTAIIIK